MRSKRTLGGSEVEFYSGHKGNESPRAVFLEGKWIRVEMILGRKRAKDIRSGMERDVFLCLLENETIISVEQSEDGRWVIYVKT